MCVNAFLTGLDSGYWKLDSDTAFVHSLRAYTHRLIETVPAETKYPALVQDVQHFLWALDRGYFALDFTSSSIDMMRELVNPTAKKAA